VQDELEVFEAQQRSLELKPDAPMVTINSDAKPFGKWRIIEGLLYVEMSVTTKRGIGLLLVAQKRSDLLTMFTCDLFHVDHKGNCL
jgi:hypothetical protein